MADTKASAKSAKVFSDEERDAMKERAKEQKAEARRGAAAADGEADVLAKIAEMPEADRVMAERLHALIKASAPVLVPGPGTGNPPTAKDGKVICFFQSSDKFKTRYLDPRLQRRRDDRRGHDVADLVRADEADRRRREADRRAREEGGQLRFGLVTGHSGPARLAGRLVPEPSVGQICMPRVLGVASAVWRPRCTPTHL